MDTSHTKYNGIPFPKSFAGAFSNYRQRARTAKQLIGKSVQDAVPSAQQTDKNDSQNSRTPLARHISELELEES